MLASANAAGEGLVASLAHPGGNITGMTLLGGPGIASKQLELLRKIAPAASRIAFLMNPRNGSHAVFAAELVELLDKFLPDHQPHDAVYRLARMTLEAIEQGCPLSAAACYFEVWMLRLAGMFPDLFMCSVCMRQIETGEDRHLAVGLQAVICSSCDHRDGVGIHPEVPVVLNWVLRNRLEGEMVKGILGSLEKGTRDLHELNQYWIRYYLER